MQEFRGRGIGYLDVYSHAIRRDTCIVFPNLDIAIPTWLILRTMMAEKLTVGNVTITKTSVVDRFHHTALRMWVPYEADPTQPMDFPHKFKYNCDYMSMFYTSKELRRIAERPVKYSRIGLNSADPD